MTIATRYSKSWAIAGIDIKDPSLVLYYPFWYPYSDMAGSTIYSYDRTRTTATVNGTITWGRDGRTFDGTSGYFSTTLPNISGAVSFEFWINPTTLSANRTLIDRRAGPTTFYNVYYYNTGEYYIFNVNNTWACRLPKAQTPTGVWTHVIWVSTDGTANSFAYVNGVDKATNQDTPTFTSGAATNQFIGATVGPDEYWDGKIGEFRMYNRALTAGEVRRNYQATKWRF